MKTQYTLLFFLIACMQVSCQKDEIPFYEDTHHIYLKQIDKKHQIDYSFVYSGGAPLVILELPVTYTGRVLEEDAAYAIRVNEEQTTALSDEYVVPSTSLFRKGRFIDTLKIQINNRERLEQTSVKLVLELVSNENFVASTRDSLKMEINFTNKISRPVWWNQNVTDFYLGTYSNEKLEEFIQIFAGDFGDLSEDDKLYYARKFKYELERREAAGDTVYEADGTKMTIPVVG